MPQCQFLFLAIFVFQKSYTGNILGIGWNKSQSSYLPDTKTESNVETEESQKAAAPWGGAAYPLATLASGVAPRPPSDIALPPVKSLHHENPNGRNIFTQNLRQAAVIVDPRLGGSRSSSSSPCQHPKWCVSSQPLDHGSIAVARWLSSPPCTSYLDLVSCLSW
jgi:hypothetical protein